MVDVTIINGSPKMERGNTAFLLMPFMAGMQKAGANIKLIYASQLQIKPCSCGKMLCWSKTPGVCIHDDEMSALYRSLKQSDILITATPVYTPLPGAMQEFLNRLCPLVEPRLRFANGRSRAQFREDVKIKKIGLVVANGWWELQNTDKVVEIFRDFTALVKCEFLPPILRPQAGNLRSIAVTSDVAKEILRSLETEGEQLIRTGTIETAIIESIQQPLMSLEDLLANWK